MQSELSHLSRELCRTARREQRILRYRRFLCSLVFRQYTDVEKEGRCSREPCHNLLPMVSILRVSPGHREASPQSCSSKSDCAPSRAYMTDDHDRLFRIVVNLAAGEDLREQLRRQAPHRRRRCVSQCVKLDRSLPLRSFILLKKSTEAIDSYAEVANLFCPLLDQAWDQHGLYRSRLFVTKDVVQQILIQHSCLWYDGVIEQRCLVHFLRAQRLWVLCRR